MDSYHLTLLLTYSHQVPSSRPLAMTALEEHSHCSFLHVTSSYKLTVTEACANQAPDPTHLSHSLVTEAAAGPHTQRRACHGSHALLTLALKVE